MRAQGQPQAVKFTLPQVPKIAIYIVGFIPAVWLFYEGINDRLGADPMRYLEQSLGLWALRFLIATLAITPLRQLLKINLLRYRRGLGLLAFYYACLHLLTYLVLDQGLDVAAIVADIVKRPYITVGMATFIILIPLAVTSNNASVRKLGGHAWARLHRLVYLAAIGAALHFILVVKSWPPEPLVYAAIVATLLGYRLIRSLIKKPQPRRRAA
ncbi:protein-methionine-sulfoxide reductase heme-binding subunit MsrQ [Microvirga brassicacearum]|uniref:Protein-methionine-sulfoxide reductase heme-binding subunit MsrQ n=1 Tax=Microvirga brassicacearum TaxID=2580413 RepID=A0A5N3PBD5_9HYPH|nr:protein-methionine-sulfoxide reductase heme-binding subunit MsrQ [Microvirga brassicacearum]KAB0267058.1 protein-methionine-sulfoxide reductase heme-binding subunit MsrQ [Microvirga brassicacearum]